MTLSDSEKKLIEAVNKGSYEEVKSLLQEPGVNVDCPDEHGMTPLQHAAYKADRSIAQLLLSHGANVNSNVHEHGYTALMFAAISGNTGITHDMLAAGANPDFTNSVGRTAAQMAGFVGQGDCASLINNFFSKSDVEYYTVIRGHEKEAKLPKHLVEPLYHLILENNLSPVFLSMFLQENSQLLDESYKVAKVLDLLCEKVMKQRHTNEILGVKFHYLAVLVRQCEKSRQERQDDLTHWIKSLVKGRDPDGFQELQERFIRGALKEFPYMENQLIQQLIRNIAPVKIGDSPTALSILTSAINGQRFQDDNKCMSCQQPEAEKKCSACKMVNYCNQACQKLQWPTHKKSCKQLAAQYREEEEAKKLEADKLAKEKEGVVSKEGISEGTSQESANDTEKELAISEENRNGSSTEE